jgi:HSP20 family protein
MFVQNDPFRQFDALFDRRPTKSSMPMDAYRRDGDVWVHIDLPGVSTESLDITVERNVLTVNASRTWAPQDGDKPYLTERRSGSFSRQVHLGEGLDAESIEADYHDGVLTLRIPVAEKAKTKKIAINAGRRDEAIDVASLDTDTVDAG